MGPWARVMHTAQMDWQYTYRSARRDGDTRRRAARRLARELAVGWWTDLGLHPRYTAMRETRAHKPG